MFVFAFVVVVVLLSLFSSLRTADEAAAAAEQFKTKKTVPARPPLLRPPSPLLAEGGGVGAHAAPRGTNPHTTTRPACGCALARSHRRLHGDVRCLLCSARAEQAAPLTSTKNPFEPLARMCAPLAGRTHEKNQNQNITRSDGCLGSCTDEERSKLRYVV